ncbi:MAG: hypothetical protein JWR80_9371 [Bradyrhizobium sp.]|nr:hypothetical protein [Bradyrhizobium sp.]
MGSLATHQATTGDDRTVSAATVTEMLASLQEAVVTSDQEVRRGLLKGVIARLREVLADEVPGGAG